MSDSLWQQHPHGLIPRGTVCKTCGRYNARDITANVLVFRKGKILLLKRAHEPGKGGWALIGGYISWDETLEEAARREMKEETGLRAGKLYLIGTRTDNSSGEGRQNIDIYFYTSEISGKIKKQEDEVVEIAWFPLDALPQPLVFDYERLLKKFVPAILQNPDGPVPVVL